MVWVVRVGRVVSILAGSLILAGAPDAHAANKKLAVLGIEAVDDGAGSQKKTTELAKTLTESLRSKVTTSTGYDLAPNSAKELAELKLLSDCLDEGAECMAAIGKDLNADVLLYGH